jgi:hypothetical protein
MSAATATGRRRCSRCKRRLAPSEFYAGGRTARQCIACDRERKRAAREIEGESGPAGSVVVPGPTVRRNRDGLVGLTAAERRAIADRIERVRKAKRLANGGELMPTTLLLILDGRSVARPDSEPSGEKRCSCCRRPLPLSEFYYYAKKKRHMQPCRACDRERRARTRKTPAYKEWRRLYDSRPEVRERIREQDRRDKARRRERRAAEGLTLRERLAESVTSARYKARRTADPAKKAKIEARILDLLHQIERIDREAIAS